jgi:hypothetical protein
MDAAEQLHSLDRDPFLRAVADRFAGQSDVDEGEFSRGLREVIRSGHFKYALSRTYSHARPVAPIA